MRVRERQRLIESEGERQRVIESERVSCDLGRQRGRKAETRAIEMRA